ncbi:MAG: hypothetical protein OQJ89_07185 [Kangiellaceae bacterium]|nr:hypothetical protein [Kangiellaceae bacterium]MCW9016729.1 hypothetical protein [Kangiellaceae bacterium]
MKSKSVVKKLGIVAITSSLSIGLQAGTLYQSKDVASGAGIGGSLIEKSNPYADVQVGDRRTEIKCRADGPGSKQITTESTYRNTIDTDGDGKNDAMPAWKPDKVTTEFFGQPGCQPGGPGGA